MTARNVFDATREVGARGDDEPKLKQRIRYRCAADRCPMAGVIFMGSTEALGVCAYHYGQNPQDWPRITAIVADDWACVSLRIQAVRLVLVDLETCTNGKAHASVMDDGALLAAEAPGWNLEPGAGEDIGHWRQRLEAFLHGACTGKPKPSTVPGKPPGPVPRGTESTITGMRPAAVIVDEWSDNPEGIF